MNLRQAALGAAALDLGAIVVFSAIGRASHEEGILGENGWGLLETVSPFATGAAFGWLIARAWRRPCDWRRTGVIVWASTLVGGMVLRAIYGQGVQVSFVIVAGTVLAAFLIGWRVLSGAIASRRGLKG
ncbi:DUF3054 domain-containing protein [Demequina phytophila]|uniref:DUF3054 domain-containing protein n=1 Tax=Demequina phytophila TaxID=1638981 RepID=UPI000781DBE2|nr:DUF3054 domain-containing protein [Demequina phytophila]